MNWLIILKLTFAHMLASYANEPSLPEFECTAIEINDVLRNDKIFGKSPYPSFSLRRYASGDWGFRAGKNSFRIKSNEVLKTTPIASSKTFYNVPYGDGSILRFELKGTPPSRNGEMVRVQSSPMDTRLIAKLTCH